MDRNHHDFGPEKESSPFAVLHKEIVISKHKIAIIVWGELVDGQQIVGHVRHMKYIIKNNVERVIIDSSRTNFGYGKCITIFDFYRINTLVI